MSLKYVDENGNEQDIAGLGKSGTEVSVEQTLTSGTKIGEISVDNVATALYAPSQAYFDLNHGSYTSNQTITSSNTLTVTSKSLTLPAGKYFLFCTGPSVTFNSTGNQFDIDFMVDGSQVATLVNVAYFGNNQLSGSVSGAGIVSISAGTHTCAWRMRTSGSKQVTLAAYSSLNFYGFKISD